MLAELPIRSQIWGIWRQETDWECGTTYYGNDPVGDCPERFVEGGRRVVICGELSLGGPLPLISTILDWTTPGTGLNLAPLPVQHAVCTATA